MDGYESSQEESESSTSQSNQNINQDIENIFGTVNNNQAGRDVNQTININIPFYDSGLPHIAMPEIKGFAIVVNYLTVFWLLFTTLISWVILGLFAKSAFPVSWVWELFKSSFQTNLWKKVDVGVQKTSQLRYYDLQAITVSENEFRRLNQIESRYKILIKILEIFAEYSSEEDLNIRRAIEVLKSKKSYTSVELNPLRSRLHPELCALQKDIFNQHKVELEEIRDLMGAMAYRYAQILQNPTKKDVEGMIKEFVSIENSRRKELGNIGGESVRKTLLLVQWVAIQVINGINHDPQHIFLVDKAKDEEKKHHHNRFCPYWQSYTYRLERNIPIEDVQIIYSRDDIPEGFRECEACKSGRSSEE
jgi:hypothetical protein